MDGKIEILGIKGFLDKLARVGVFPPEIQSACSQAGSFLFAFRQTALSARSDEEIVRRLKEFARPTGRRLTECRGACEVRNGGRRADASPSH